MKIKALLFGLLIIAALLAAGCQPQTVVETVVVEKEGETIVETVEVEVEKEVSTTQYGFRPAKNTAHAILVIRKIQDFKTDSQSL